VLSIVNYLRNPLDADKLLVPTQIQYDVAFSPAANTYFAAGWSGLKTWAMLYSIYILLIKNYGLTGLIVLPTEKMVSEFVDQLFEPAFARMGFEWRSKRDRRAWVLGGEVVFLSGHVPERIESYTAAWGVADEIGLMSRTVWTKLVARTRDPRAVYRKVKLFGTPYYGWLSDAFGKRDDSECKIYHSRTVDNPYISQEFIDSLSATCPASQRAAYLDGQFVSPSSVVWPEFGERHLVDWSYDYYVTTVTGHRIRSEIGALIDWSPRHPKVLFAQIVPAGVVIGHEITTQPTAVIVDELQPDGHRQAIDTRTLCQQILARGYPLSWVIADPAGKQVEASSGIAQATIAQAELGMKLTYPPERSIQIGIDHVRLALAPINGMPRILISKELATETHPRGVVNSARTYAYSQDKDGKPLAETPKEDGIAEDASDLMRYLAVTKCPGLQRRLDPIGYHQATGEQIR
jgi:hypothetical protein